MFIALDNKVINLKRIEIGDLKLGTIKSGEYQTIIQSQIYQKLGLKVN
jgi:16S rRNA U516 pseudouridylate synthase RsuA-like enzyme